MTKENPVTPAVETDGSVSEGMELLLTGVPNRMSAVALQKRLEREYLRIPYAFSVILEKSPDDSYWDSFNKDQEASSVTARVIVPNESEGYNPAEALVGETINVNSFNQVPNQVKVNRRTHPETPNHKYKELREKKPHDGEQSWPRHTRVGHISKVSCGSFNGEKCFEVAHTWSYDKKSKSPALSYFDDARPPKFRICLPKEKSAGWEWDWKVREDVRDDKGFPNTDGCGLISPELCDAINKALTPFGFASSRAFQIRFGGVKGVVYAGANSLLTHGDGHQKMLLRKSQVKIRVPDSRKLGLRIVSTAGSGYQSLFLAPALKAFEDSGAKTDEIERIYDEAYQSLRVASSKGVDLLQQIHTIPYALSTDGMKMGRHSLLKLAMRLKDEGINPTHYSSTFLAAYLTKLAEKAHAKDLFKIPIPGSFSLLGLTDDYEVLEQGEVFIRAQGKTIEGPVLIYRDPIIHIGDIQEARAMREDKLKQRLELADGNRLGALLQMDNIIFFSQKDTPPFPSRLSGGDLDGDRFEILTKDCRFWQKGYEISSWEDYTNAEVPAFPSEPYSEVVPNGEDAATAPFDVAQLAAFIAKYIRNDCFEVLQRRLLSLADMKQEGMKDPDVKDLAKWLSRAVDYAKSGKEVDLVGDVLKNPKFTVDRKPDFLRAIGRRAVADSSAGHQESESLLGKLYRKFRIIHYHQVEDMDHRPLIDNLAGVWELTNEEDTPVLIQDSYLDDFNVEIWRQLELYRAFMKAHDCPISGTNYSAEVAIFLGKSRDDFPHNFVRDLKAITSGFMVNTQKMAAWSERGPQRIQPLEGYDKDLLERTYKNYLYQAWTVSIQDYDTRYEVGCGLLIGIAATLSSS
ncbi:hypothetical protein BHE90_003974 [Fusarium euwallaceae]|uniref:RNA-dependent RNA polymerase n=2 Tax=Fusarium solani species complex TaxID=232080 RepID=A0A3M2SGH7_9HYPO|nr:hypothetical protein CDV36_003639 [Fusarium kuroshium]RTE81521.1 hypothetical protein BHE90_003974 [Fusarium euwallaceae]